LYTFSVHVLHMIYICFIFFSYTHILFNFVKYHIFSKQIENIILKSNNNEIRECGYMELDPLYEEITYREYIICLKKHQLAIE